MSQQQQQQHQQIQHLQQQPQPTQGLLQRDAMAQLAAQVQSQVVAPLASVCNTMMGPSGPVQGSIIVNPNISGSQVIPTPGQIQNLAAYHQIPVMWNAHQTMATGQQSQNYAPTLLPPQQQAPSGQFAARFADNQPRTTSVIQTGSLPPTLVLHQAHATPAPISDASQCKNDEPVSKRGGKKKSKYQGGKGGKDSKAMASKEEGEEYLADGTRTQHNRERNREHARSTRLRKKAYIQKLKEMANGLRTVQTEEIRQRRTATQRMMEIQHVRRTVLHTMLAYHANFESDPAKWNILLEDSFWLKEPVTPFRSFRRSEVERDCRIVRGADALICDAASVSVMIERVGCHNARWRRIKRNDFLRNGEDASFSNVIGVSQQPESSLSGSDSSRGSSFNSKRAHSQAFPEGIRNSGVGAKKVSSSSASGNNVLQTLQIGMSNESSNHHSDSQDTIKNELNNSSSDDADEEPLPMLPKTVSGHQPYADVVPSNAGLSGPSTRVMGTVIPNFLSRATLQLANTEQISAIYAMNEDDMIMIDDVMMCPFVFRTKNAVLCGALADCVMPGMLRAQFSKRNKLLNMELIFDAMGFMQQLDGANGGEVTAQVVPGSLEMALMHSPHEARVITEANPPFCVLHVNEAWTRLTQYTQLEVEGKPLLSLLEGDDTECNSGKRPEKPTHSLNEVARGRAACSTNIHYGRLRTPFVDFMCSYPLTNSTDEITHLLHVNMELPKIGSLI